MASELETSTSFLKRLQDTRDTKAWNEFNARYSPYILRRLGYEQIRGPNAEDLCQDVLTIVASAIQEFDYRHAGAFRGWLKAIVKNRVVSFQRSKVRERKRLEEYAKNREDCQNDDFRSLEESLDFLWLFEIVADDCPLATVEMMRCYFFDSCSVSEIAEKFNTTNGAFGAAKCRFVKKLRLSAHRHGFC